MLLSPLDRIGAPSYPSRRPPRSRLGRWARRAGAAVAATLAIGAAACYGQTRDFERDSGAPDSGLPDTGADADVDVVVLPDADRVDDADVRPDADAPTRFLGWCEPDYRLSGEAMPADYSGFVCGAEMPADTPTLEAPLYLREGLLCGAQTAWSRVNVPESTQLALSFPYGSEDARVTAFAPDGSAVVAISPEHPCAQLQAEEGIWTLAADPAGPDVPPETVFVIAFDQLQEY